MEAQNLVYVQEVRRQNRMLELRKKLENAHRNYCKQHGLSYVSASGGDKPPLYFD